MAAIHHLTELFEGFTAKPDIIVDDLPCTCIAPFVYDVQKEDSWATLADTIIERHVDCPVA